MQKNQKHTFHLVDQSPWPIFMSFYVLLLTNGAALFFHFFNWSLHFLLIGLFFVIITMILWWRDVIRESTFQGQHTQKVVKGLVLGVILFIVSEIMFFVAFFWAFLHSSLVPTIQIGAIWPPIGIVPFEYLDVPLLNTLILLLSGATVTWAHHSIVAGSRYEAIWSLILTIILAILFTILQVLEYIEASFDISDGVYGSAFFMATGFHGFHVIIGSLFLSVCLFRIIKYHFTMTHHLGFEGAAWYWHFVDVVWLYLYIVVYFWGNSLSLNIEIL